MRKGGKGVSTLLQRTSGPFYFSMPAAKARINREKQTIRHMIGIHCRGRHHNHKALCPECLRLLDYAMQCIDRCPFGEDKPTCGRCPIHCYKPGMREQIRMVMRYAGPRMMISHPFLTALHYMDELRRAQKKGKKPKA